MEAINTDLNLYEICKPEDMDEKDDSKHPDEKPEIPFKSFRELMRWMYIVPISTVKQNDFMQKQYIKDIQKETKKS